jgi:hypothetical protein
MTLGEYIKQGGRYYQKLHMGNDLWNYVLKGINYSGEPSEDFKQEAQDIKEGKSLVLCPKGVIISQDVVGNPTVSWGVYVFYPKIDWQKEPRLKNFREMTIEEILKKEQELCIK